MKHENQMSLARARRETLDIGLESNFWTAKTS